MTSARFTVLVLDDELPIRRLVKHALEDGGMRVIEAATAREGLDLAAAERPDLIVLDLGLPDGRGVDVCGDLRGWSKAPILVLSARHDDSEKVALLDAGADDYMTKPFGQGELAARVRALLRRASSAGPTQDAVVRGDLTVDFTRRAVLLGGKAVHLTPLEWELLRTLATQPGKVLTHRQLFHSVWKGRDHGDAQQYLRVYVAHLRRKLEKDPVRPQHIFTIPGVGYKFGE